MTRPNGRPLDGLQRVDDQPNRLGVKLWLGYNAADSPLRFQRRA